MRKPRKWITWEIPREWLEEATDKQIELFKDQIREEAEKALEDMIASLPVTFKFTNLPRDW